MHTPQDPLPSTLINLSGVRYLVREVLGCGCPEEVFDRIAVGSPTLYSPPGGAQLVELEVGGRLLISVVDFAKMKDPVAERRALMAHGQTTRDTRGLNRFRLVLVGDIPPAQAERLLAPRAEEDERTHLHLVAPSQLPGA